MLRVVFLCSMSMAASLLSGCSDSTDPNRPQTAPVRGVVMYKQQPVADAGITFIPQNHEHAAVGRTDSSGRFQLRTFSLNDGAVPGEFKVTIVTFDIPDVPFQENISDAELERREKKTEPAPPKSLIPTKYAAQESSELVATITPGTNDITFELKD